MRLETHSQYFKKTFSVVLPRFGRPAGDVVMVDGCVSHKGPDGLTADDFTVFLQQLELPM